MTSVGVLALTPSPPPHTDVALAFGADAAGFVDVDAEPDEYASAVRAVHGGEGWLPEDDVRALLRDVADDLDVTTSERRSRLLTVAIGLVPAAGALAAVLSLLWRKFFGQIGVRPVDLAVDPTTRVIDAVRGRAGLSWIAERPKLAAGAISFGLLVVGALLSIVADLVLILFVGPIVAISILAEVLDLTPELPRPLRISLVSRSRAAVVGMTTLFLFLVALSTEVLLIGPASTPRAPADSWPHESSGSVPSRRWSTPWTAGGIPGGGGRRGYPPRPSH